MTVLTGEYLEIYGTKVKSEDTRGHGLSGLEEIQTLVDGPNPRDQNMGEGGISLTKWFTTVGNTLEIQPLKCNKNNNNNNINPQYHLIRGDYF